MWIRPCTFCFLSKRLTAFSRPCVIHLGVIGAACLFRMLLLVSNFAGHRYRVSSTGKRPDHVIQILADGTRSYLLSIESKSRASDLEEMIGPSLKEYTRQLVATPPTIQRVPGQEWQLWPGRETLPQRFTQLSGGAFCWLGVDDLEKTLSRCSLDMVLALEFHSVEQPALLHIKIKEAALPLLPMLRNSFQQFAGWLEVQIH